MRDKPFFHALKWPEKGLKKVLSTQVEHLIYRPKYGIL